MKLSTGKVAFPIEFDNGDKQNIYFNPNDPNLSVRLKDFQDRVSERIKALDDVRLDAKGTPEDVEKIEEFRRIQNVLYEELDVAFGGEVSAVVFKHCSPFAIVNGDYFLMQFIETIKPEIEKHIKKASSAVEARMKKHLDKYGAYKK